MEKLHFGEIIGSGSFGKVYKGTWNGITVALKCIQLPPGSDTSLLPTPTEIEVLRLGSYIYIAFNLPGMIM